MVETKMTNPMITIHNMETNEIVEREMNAEELTQYNKTIADVEQQHAALQAEADAKASAQSKLAALGLTVEEIAALSK
jgi:hypothetical protein